MLFANYLSQANPQLHLTNCLALQTMTAEDPKAAMIAAGLYGVVDADQAVLIDPTSTNTRAIAIFDGRRLLIMIDGLRTFAQARDLVLNWDYYNLRQEVTGMSKPFCDAARTTQSRIPPTWFASSIETRIIGYSYGGATGACLGAIRKQFFPSQPMRVYSYGAPRPGTLGSSTHFRSSGLIRVAGRFDPVPTIPPHPDEEPLICLMAPERIRAGMNTQEQPFRGYYVNTDGSTTVNYEDHTIATQVRQNLADWLVSGAVFANDFHSLTAYVTKFTRGVAANPPINLAEPPTTRVRTPDIGPTAERTLMREAALASGLEVAGNPEVATNEIYGVIVPTPKLRFRKATILGVRACTYDGEIVAFFVGKREQRRVVRDLNRRLKASGM